MFVKLKLMMSSYTTSNRTVASFLKVCITVLIAL